MVLILGSLVTLRRQKKPDGVWCHWSGNQLELSVSKADISYRAGIHPQTYQTMNAGRAWTSQAIGNGMSKRRN
jgi:hypothetical protein